MIEVRNLSKRFGQILAVDNVSFTVERGDVLGFLGPNGAGKSTTMRVITGYLPPDGGTAIVGKHDITEEAIQAKSLIGYLPENAPLYEEMKVDAFLCFVAAMHGLGGKDKRHAVDRVFDVCALGSVRTQTIGTLSKGYRRRVCFAQALVHDPKVLIMDEPTDGLDPNQKHEMRNLIKHLGEKKAVIISTHILEEVDAACSRVAIIDKGKMIFNGLPKELRLKSPGSGLLRIAILDQARGDVMMRLRALPEIDKVQCFKQDDHHVYLHLFPTKPDADLAPVVAKVCLDERWLVGEMTVEPGRLDEVFRQLTSPGSSPTFPTAMTTWDAEMKS